MLNEVADGSSSSCCSVPHLGFGCFLHCSRIPRDKYIFMAFIPSYHFDPPSWHGTAPCSCKAYCGNHGFKSNGQDFKSSNVRDELFWFGNPCFFFDSYNSNDFRMHLK